MKKNRRVRYYNKWRCDSLADYGSSLSPADRAWLDKFEREYYCGENHGIHPDEYRNELYTQNNIAARDIVTVTGDAVTTQTKIINRAYATSKTPSLLSRWYHPSDYAPRVQDPQGEEGEVTC